MAKRQTRRTISVSRVAYEQLKGKCATHGVAMSSVVEQLIRKWAKNGSAVEQIVEIAMSELVDVQTTPAPSLEHVERQQAAARAAMRREIDERSMRLRREFEVRAESNPCRRERCSIRGLHPAHGNGVNP